MRLSGKSRAFEITAFFAISLCTYQVRAEENELVNIFGRNIIYSNSIQDSAACQGTFDILNHSAKVRRMVDLPYDISRKVVEYRAQVFAREFVENFP